MYQTGPLSSLFEIDRTTLNYYVRSGLLKPQVLENQYHAFSEQDAVALAQLRYYLGLDFDTRSIQRFLYESEAADILQNAEQKLTELQETARRLQLKQAFLQNFIEFLRVVRQQPAAPLVSRTEPYYFLQRSDLTDPALRELFRMIPFNEYSFDVEPDFSLRSGAPSSLGLALRQSWVEEYHLPLPERCLYYPARNKVICVLHTEGTDREKQLQDQLRRVYRSQQEDGRTLARHFEAYSLLTHYTKETKFDMMAFFSYT